MRYRPKNIGPLHIALGGLPDKMRVEADADIGVSAKSVGELRKLAAWPENLAVTTPQDYGPENAVKVSKVSVATRTSPSGEPRTSEAPSRRLRAAQTHFMSLAIPL